MPQKTYAGTTVDVDGNGYLTDFGQWTREIALEIAREEEIPELGDKHWQVIEYLQKNHKEGVPLSIRKVGKSGVVSIQELYDLFPGGPLKKATRIAGIPKPASCV